MKVQSTPACVPTENAQRHVALFFHRVREAIAAKIIVCHLINGKINPADVFSKNWDHHSVWVTSKPLFLERRNYGMFR